MDAQATPMESCVECIRAMKASGEELVGGGDVANESSWNQYIARYGFQDAWNDIKHRTEQDRYGLILERLEASQQRLLAAQREIVQEKANWTFKMRRSANQLEPHKAEVLKIMETADKVQRDWADSKATDNRHASQVFNCTNKWPRLYSGKKVRIGDWTAEDTEEVTAITTAVDPRYYLGHEGGDYIFRYSGEDRADDSGETVSAASAIEMTFKPWLSPCWNSILTTDPIDLPRQFLYCGQVPRHVKEYAARIHELMPAIVKMIVSLVGFHRAGGEDEPLSQELQELTGLNSASSRADLVRLRQLWMDEFPKDGKAPEEIRVKLRCSAKVSEFAAVVLKMTTGSTTTLTELAPIIETLEKSTGWSFFEMVDIEDVRTARRAFHELLHNKFFEHVLVLDDLRIRDIHAFYSNTRFQSDPLHPSRRYELRDVSAQLEHSYWLGKSGWDDEDPEPDPDPETTDLQDLEGDGEDSSTVDSNDEDYLYTEDEAEEENERPPKRARASKSAGRHTASRNERETPARRDPPPKTTHRRSRKPGPGSREKKKTGGR